MTTELTILGWSVILLIAQIVLQTQFAVNEFGLPYAFSPRDDRRLVVERHFKAEWHDERF